MEKIILKEYHNNKGQLHSIDGPASIWSDGTKKWYINDKLHRIDGPAIEWADGTKEWFCMGMLHRVDGPAREYDDGEKEWWCMGKKDWLATDKESIIMSNKYRERLI